MSIVAKLVEGDTPPRILLDLIDEETGVLISTDGLTGAVLRWRQEGAPDAPALEAEGLVDQPGGLSFALPPGALATPGNFEAEICLLFGARRHTLHDPLRFIIRKQFA